MVGARLERQRLRGEVMAAALIGQGWWCVLVWGGAEVFLNWAVDGLVHSGGGSHMVMLCLVVISLCLLGHCEWVQ